MTTKALQVYLTPEQHSALKEAARRSRKAMTELVREAIEREFVSGRPPPTDLSDMVGILRSGEPTDVARDRDRMLIEVLHDLRGR